MLGIYRAPLRVYLLLGALAIWGVMSGLGLSISLFPMANQVTVAVHVGTGSYSSRQFYDSIGKGLEGVLHATKADKIAVDTLQANYLEKEARYNVKFDWGADPDQALKTVETNVNAHLAQFDQEVRDSAKVTSWRSDGGFLALSFYSPMRSLDEIYQILEPIVTPIKSKIPDAAEFGLFNPNQKEITIRLAPEKLARYGLSTVQIQRAIADSIFSYSGGAMRVGEKEHQITLPKKAASLEALANVRVSPVSQDPVLLKDVAKIEVGPREDSLMRFTTSGVESLILFASPKEGGNIKRMADDAMRAVDSTKSQWPADLQYKILVNPSDFINKSVQGVLHEVGIAALLAVVVLFIFIGSFKNVVTAAIEIPLSLLLAFILMRLTGMNLNLISLGGLALSAGMNVDASVVVLENIFRHFEGKPKNLSYEEKAKIVVGAVNEVKLPIIASTIASLVVFLPLVFTRGLTNSLLGDLAKSVIFSHGLSAIVALVLVPTIRLQFLAHGELSHGKSPFEGALAKLEAFYERTLSLFLRSFTAQVGALAAICVILPALILFVVPRLPKEVIGKPESDWLVLGFGSPVINTPKQNQAEYEVFEADVLKQFGEETLYTFTQVHGASGGNVMLRLKDRDKVQELLRKAEEVYKNTPTKFYFAVSWTPAELQIPDPPDYRLEVIGGSALRRQQVGHDLTEILRDPTVMDSVQDTPSTEVQKGLVVSPIPHLIAQPEVLTRGELSHFLRTATSGIRVDKVVQGNTEVPIFLRMPKDLSTSIERIAALPVGFEGRLIPIGALAKVSLQEKEPAIYSENEQQMTKIEGRVKKVNKPQAKERIAAAKAAVSAYREKLSTAEAGKEIRDNPVIVEAQADRELQEALDQLKWAVLLSIALIFLTMVLQLGDVVHSLLVLVAIPLGLIGVIASLTLFGSTLSLNSGLGTILLNGIAVANSIILVDFIRHQYQSGLGAFEATVKASTARLRPILMTSLCTVLGMLPIALGFGEGGKTLQPLGIAVCGGLWLSMSLTLYLVPSLQYQYLHWKSRKRIERISRRSDQREVRA